MGRWLITATEVVNYELEVEADSYGEAIVEAERTSNETFDEFCQVEQEFTIDDAQEINS